MGIKHKEELGYKAVLNGFFDIKSDGTIWRIRSRRRGKDGTMRVLPCDPVRIDRKIRSGNPLDKSGKYYLAVWLPLGRENGTRKRTVVYAHRLVYRYFHGPIPDNVTVNHKDGVRTNNQPENLELATHKEQIAHSIEILQTHPAACRRGSDNPVSKLKDSDVDSIRLRSASGEPYLTIAKDFPFVSYQTVWSVATYKSWRWKPRIATNEENT
jgi:hypothetical protein